MNILLTTLNARYIHSALGLRYILANMGHLESQTEICEFIINTRPIDIAEQLLDKNPSIIGFGVYIWNIEQTTQLVALIKEISPNTIIVVGGPEVSFEQTQQVICQLADYVICGAADLAFAELCEELLTGELPEKKIIFPLPFRLSSIKLPYGKYTNSDIKNRVIYVEASRGCPFKCEFCLSALDKTAKPFDLEQFLEEMDKLYQRGARHFKFVDRTFNLKIQSSIKILDFFLERLDEDLFLHFELIPDHLPEALKQRIKKFPDKALQFEIGIQSFNPEVQSLI
ncbi:MAG TPA: radical SAM protein, partial [Gammaproteobacteria bacterium]|nr:radical SAM protein [Gammaproteobacteria bacterium]